MLLRTKVRPHTVNQRCSRPEPGGPTAELGSLHSLSLHSSPILHVSSPRSHGMVGVLNHRWCLSITKDGVPVSFHRAGACCWRLLSAQAVSGL